MITQPGNCSMQYATNENYWREEITGEGEGESAGERGKGELLERGRGKLLERGGGERYRML